MAWNQKRFWYTCISRRGCVGEGLAGASKQGLAGLQGKARRGRGAAAGVQSVSPGDWECWAEQFRWQGGGVGGGQCEEDNDNDNKEGGRSCCRGAVSHLGWVLGWGHIVWKYLLLYYTCENGEKQNKCRGAVSQSRWRGVLGWGHIWKCTVEKSKTNAVMCACYQQQSEPDRQMHFFELSIFSEEKIFTLLSMSCLL